MPALAIAGDLTIQTAADWQSKLIEAIRSDSSPVIDLSAVSSCDAAGLQLLCSFRLAAPAARIAAIPAAVREAAEALGIDAGSFSSET